MIKFRNIFAIFSIFSFFVQLFYDFFVDLNDPRPPSPHQNYFRRHYFALRGQSYFFEGVTRQKLQPKYKLFEMQHLNKVHILKVVHTTLLVEKVAILLELPILPPWLDSLIIQVL